LDSGLLGLFGWGGSNVGSDTLSVFGFEINCSARIVTKYLVSAIAMALIFKFVRPLEEVIFLCVLFVGFLVVPVIGYRHVLANQQSK
jgi:hypothetical protein